MNKCGECTECCHSLGVNEDSIKYDFGSSCEHVCSTGCSVYNKRPVTCQSFLCSYRKLNLNEKYRPDRYGMVIRQIPDNTILIWPNRHGQNDINPDEWFGENKEKVLDLINEIMLSSEQYTENYQIQTFNGILNKKTYK